MYLTPSHQQARVIKEGIIVDLTFSASSTAMLNGPIGSPGTEEYQSPNSRSLLSLECDFISE